MIDIDIKSLVQLREDYATLKAKLDTVQEGYLQTYRDIFADQIGALAVLRMRIDNVEDEIRTLTLDNYKETGQKSWKYGLGVRVLKRLQYEPQEALSWAKTHQIALTLDVSAFETIAKTISIPGVSIVEEPIATIPKQIILPEDERGVFHE